MLKVEIKEGENTIEAKGSVVELLSDVGVLIKVIYEELNDDDCRKFFEEKLKCFVNDGIYKMSAEEFEKLNEERRKEQRENAKNELLESLGELIKLLEKVK